MNSPFIVIAGNIITMYAHSLQKNATEKHRNARIVNKRYTHMFFTIQMFDSNGCS